MITDFNSLVGKICFRDTKVFVVSTSYVETSFYQLNIGLRSYNKRSEGGYSFIYERYIIPHGNEQEFIKQLAFDNKEIFKLIS